MRTTPTSSKADGGPEKWAGGGAEGDWPESIFFFKRSLQPRGHLFTSMQRACLHAAMLNVYGHMRAPSHRPTRGNMAVSAQAALFQAAARKLLSASCCTQVARHLSSSCSVHVVQVSLRKTLGACICAQDAQPELSCGGAPRTIRLRFSRSRQEYTPHTTASLLEPELPRTRRDSNPRPRDCESTTQLPKAVLRVMKSHGATARALRHARSPQRVHRD